MRLSMPSTRARWVAPEHVQAFAPAGSSRVRCAYPGYASPALICALKRPALAQKAWRAIEREQARVGRTVVLNLKTSDFRALSRSLTPATPPAAKERTAPSSHLVRSGLLPSTIRT